MGGCEGEMREEGRERFGIEKDSIKIRTEILYRVSWKIKKGRKKRITNILS